MRGDSYNPSAGNDGYMSRDIYDMPGNGDIPLDRRPEGLPGAAYNDYYDPRKRRRTPSPTGGARGGGRYDPRPRYFVQSGPPPGTGNGYGGAPPFENRERNYRGGWDGPAGRGNYRDQEFDRARERGYDPEYNRNNHPGYGQRRSVSPRRGPDSHWPPAGDARYPYSRDDNNRQGPGEAHRCGPEAAGPGLLDPEQSENSVSIDVFGQWYKAAHPDQVSEPQREIVRHAESNIESNHADILAVFLPQLTAKDPNTGENINISAVIEKKYEEYRNNFLIRQVGLDHGHIEHRATDLYAP